MTAPVYDYTAIATRVMLALTGWRWTWPERQVTEIYRVPNGQTQIFLTGRPATLVQSVTDPGGNAVQFTLTGGNRLTFPERYGNPYIPDSYQIPGGYWIDFNHPSDLAVTYRYGSKPPSDVVRAIDELASNLQLADTGGDCKLPARVTSVSRQGVSWTLLDPQDFLDQGRTGLYFPDLVIKLYGGKVKRRTRVFSPEYLPPRLVSRSIYLEPADISDIVAIDNGDGTYTLVLYNGASAVDNGNGTWTLTGSNSTSQPDGTYTITVVNVVTGAGTVASTTRHSDGSFAVHLNRMELHRPDGTPTGLSLEAGAQDGNRYRLVNRSA